MKNPIQKVDQILCIKMVVPKIDEAMLVGMTDIMEVTLNLWGGRFSI